MSQFLSLHHASVIVADTARALEFYHRLLGLELDRTRPDLGYPGAWLRIGEQQLHLLELPNPDPVSNRPPHVGRDRHVAFQVDNLDSLQSRLDQAGIAFTRSRSGRQAIFCRDPDGNGIELIGSIRPE